MKSKYVMNQGEEPSVQVETFFMQKLGNKPKEYEDAFHYDLEKGKFAVADGASESCFAKLWADLLTRSFVESDLSLFSSKRISKRRISKRTKKKIMKSFVLPAQEKWDNKIEWNNLAWYIQERARRGAFATFLGLETKCVGKPPKFYRWRVLVVGDCCFFHLSSRLHLVKSFPLNNSDQFGNVPSLLSSKSLRRISRSAEYRETDMQIEEGEIRPREKIVLTTDAVAKWILEEIESGQDFWQKVVQKPEKTRSILKELIETKKIRNDDITLLTISF